MALLSQLIPAATLAKLNESHLNALNAHLEAELLTNPTIKQALTGKAHDVLKQIGH